MEQLNKKITVLSYGSAPYFNAGEGTRIPHGYSVGIKVNGIALIAVTRVTGDGVKYKFFMRDNASLKSKWHKDPHKALDEAQALAGNTKYKKGEKNALHAMGLFTEETQLKIKDLEFEAFCNGVFELAIPPPPPKRVQEEESPVKRLRCASEWNEKEEKAFESLLLA